MAFEIEYYGYGHPESLSHLVDGHSVQGDWIGVIDQKEKAKAKGHKPHYHSKTYKTPALEHCKKSSHDEAEPCWGKVQRISCPGAQIDGEYRCAGHAGIRYKAE